MQARLQSLEQLIWEVRRTFSELASAAERELQVLGIQAAERAFLEFLAKEVEPISISDLARKYSVSRQHIHQTLRRLQNPEWVDEVPDIADRRIVRIRLSRRGWACWRKIRVVDRAFLNRLAEHLSQEGMVTATDVLRRLRRELTSKKGDL